MTKLQPGPGRPRYAGNLSRKPRLPSLCPCTGSRLPGVYSYSLDTVEGPRAPTETKTPLSPSAYTSSRLSVLMRMGGKQTLQRQGNHRIPKEPFQRPKLREEGRRQCKHQGRQGACAWGAAYSLSLSLSLFKFFGLWRVRFPPCLVRPGRRLPVQGLSVYFPPVLIRTDRRLLV